MVAVMAIGIVILQAAIFGLFLVAVRRGNTAAAINALASLVLALLPVVTEFMLQTVFTRSVAFGPELAVWLAVAGVLHSLGMLGLYESTWWWDHLTHTVSAALVAALLYAGLLVTLPEILGRGTVSGSAVMAVTVLFTFAIGVFWELLELVARELGERFDIDPVLIHYGWDDTAADLGFDIVGALIVIGADLRLFVPLMEQMPGVTRALLIGSGWIVGVGSVLMAVGVALGSSTRP